MKKKIVGLGIITLWALTACSTPGPSASAPASTNLVWATSSQGSDVYTASVALSDVVNNNSDLKLTVQSVGGSEASLHAIAAGDADIALVNSLAAQQAYTGDGNFEQPLDIRMHLDGFSSARQLLVRADSGIETPADLAGKTCACSRPALGELAMMTDAMLEVWKVDPTTVKIVPTNETNEAINALKQRTVDAVVLPGSAGAGPFLELSEQTDVKWIDLSSGIEEMIDILGPAFVTTTIPADTYKGNEKDVVTIGLQQITVVSSTLTDDAVSSMTAAVLDNVDQINDRTGPQWEAASTDSFTLPFHPAVVEYYKNKKLWTAEMEAHQETLLKPSN